MGDNWSKVTSGENFQCAFENPYIGHKIYCWGNLFAGENSTLPIQEATGSSDWKYMDSGRFHSCAIKLDGTLYCWGVNGYGQLGHETTIVQSTPSKQSNDTDWAQISAGYNHTCGLKNNLTGKSLWCWGNNSLGQIGNGSSNLGANVTIPQQESRLDKDWTFVDTGDASTCAIKNTGTLWCWGWLGSVYYTSNIPTQMGIEADWLSISVGRDHFCGIRIDNSLWCWGTNSLGQLGDGTLVEKTFSDMIAVEETKSKDWSEVHSGRGNTCGLKLDGRIFCWGEGNGSNGNGSSWYIEPQLVLFP